MVKKFLNEARGPRDGGNSSPAASPVALPASAPAPGLESSAAGAARDARNDGVDERFSALVVGARYFGWLLYELNL